MFEDSLDPLDALRREYLALTRVELPEAARAAAREGGAWPISLDHCFMRIILDAVFGRRWDDAIDRRRGPAYRQLDAGQLRDAIQLAKRMLAEGRDGVRDLNERSLSMRSR